MLSGIGHTFDFFKIIIGMMIRIDMTQIQLKRGLELLIMRITVCHKCTFRWDASVRFLNRVYFLSLYQIISRIFFAIIVFHFFVICYEFSLICLSLPFLYLLNFPARPICHFVCFCSSLPVFSILFLFFLITFFLSLSVLFPFLQLAKEIYSLHFCFQLHYRDLGSQRSYGVGCGRRCFGRSARTKARRQRSKRPAS